MMLFDTMLAALEEIFLKYESDLSLREHSQDFFVNRDLRGRAALVWDEGSLERMSADEQARLGSLCSDIATTLEKHAFPASRMPILAAAPFATDKEGAVEFTYGERFPYTVVDRMLTESSWSIRSGREELFQDGCMTNLSRKMVVFSSIKGCVGRSTALAAAAWYFAQLGKKVMVVDMDLESPGLSSSLLPEDRRPEYGLLDWLVEDVVGNGDAIQDSLWGTSPLADGSQGEIVVIPAHGKRYGNYIAKMGRAWMPRMDEGKRIPWPRRLLGLLQELDNRYAPECVLIDARAGLNETASVSVLDLAPRLVLLFAMQDIQTWTGYSILFEHWKSIGQNKDIRQSLQMVAAMIPLLEDKSAYIESMRENAWNCFMNCLYDNISDKHTDRNYTFSFDRNDTEAPHSPWIIYWNQIFSSIQKLYTINHTLDAAQIQGTFPFILNLEKCFF